MRFIHLSDTHLGHRGWGLPEREKDFYEVFSEVVEIAIRENVEAVLHGGDMFDRTDPPPQTYIVTYRELTKLKEKGISFYVIAGDHDLPSTVRRSPLEFFRSIGLINLLSLENSEFSRFTSRDGLKVELVGYSKRASRLFFEGEGLQRSDPSRDVVRIALVHALTCEPFQALYRWSDDTCREMGYRKLASIGDKAEMFRYIALGDLHMPWECEVKSVPAYYPGSTEVLDRGEAFNNAGEFIERGVYVVDVDHDGVSTRRVKLEKTRPWIRIEGLDYKELLNKIRSIQWSKFRKPPIVYLLLRKAFTSTERDHLIKELNNLTESKKIFRFDLVVEESSGETMHVTHSKASESMEVISIENVLREFFKDQELSDLLCRFIDEGIEGEDLLNTLMNRRDLIDKLYKVIKDLR